MANVVNVLFSLSFLRLLGFVLLVVSVMHTQNASSVGKKNNYLFLYTQNVFYCSNIRNGGDTDEFTVFSISFVHIFDVLH